MKQRVIVIGHGYTSRLGVIRALGRAGYEVTVIVIMLNKRNGKPDTTRPIDSYSKYVDHIHYCPPDKDRLIALLLEKCVEEGPKAILFPDSDFSAAAIDLNQKKLEEHFLFPHIDHTPGAVVVWMNKLRQKELARQVGLNVARGEVIEVADGDYRIPSGLSYPCFPKPLATLVGAKTGLGRCDTEQQLRKSIDALVRRSSTISILVEEYKHIDQEFALMGVSDGTTVHIPGILRISSLASGTHYGVAIKGEIIPIEGFEDLLESFKVFVRETSYVGIFDIDFYRSGSRFYFCEMNFRYGGSGYAYTRSGVNLPAMFVHAINGESIDTSVMVKDKAVYLNERMCLDDWYKGYITTREFKTLLRSRDISFIADEEDPEPERMFRKLILQNGFKRIIKKCLGRK
ncbi:MAG: hypothetical protein IJK96_03620 [Bacteroidales bacterium]|nr:hypothetical protein [Bacteroidales bacterium]